MIFISIHFLIKLSIETYRNCLILSLFLNLKINNMIIIEFDIEKKYLINFKKWNKCMNCLDYFFSDFVVEINTKSRSLKSLWLKKLRLLRVSMSADAYEINKKRSIQTIKSGLVTVVKSLQQRVILHTRARCIRMLIITFI